MLETESQLPHQEEAQKLGGQVQPESEVQVGIKQQEATFICLPSEAGTRWLGHLGKPVTVQLSALCSPWGFSRLCGESWELGKGGQGHLLTIAGQWGEAGKTDLQERVIRSGQKRSAGWTLRMRRKRELLALQLLLKSTLVEAAR